MSEQPLIYDLTISDLREMSWWPNGQEARIHAGQPGHQYEIVLNIGDYDLEPGGIPDLVEEAIAAVLPDSWKVANRTTRLELHPAGHFAGGFMVSDVQLVEQALPQLGFVLGSVEVNEDNVGYRPLFGF